MEIQPDKQNLDQTFASTVYHIDFYQRDYKWNEEPVRRLLDDVFYQFEEAYAHHSALDPTKENVNSRYPWYYLNTYVTNEVGGRVFVVDGQQRLTTLTLILVKLHALARNFKSKTEGWLDRKIAGYSGTDHQFWMNHARHPQVLSALVAGTEPSTIDTTTGITAVNMIRNYLLISGELDAHLDTSHKFETFVYFFLCRLVLINLSVESDHVPMVFEVINDRGVRLKPYEILKGKLLGQIDKQELERERFNELWDGRIHDVNAFGDDEIDSFFRYWLKAHFSDTRKAGQRFDSDYHREMFKGDLNQTLKLDHNAAAVKSFLKGAFQYYTKLYCQLWKATQQETKGAEAVFFNKLNEQDTQFMLVLAACKVGDPDEAAKIEAVATGLDRMVTLLQLQGAYDSNQFAARLFEVSAALRGCETAQIAGIFQEHLLLEIQERRGPEVKEAFSYALFRPMSTDRLNTRFTRYFYARVDRELAAAMRQKPKHEIRELVTARGTKNGFHIEHILSRNAANLAHYGGDEGRFDEERNRLGGILLLKGKDNISSGNESFTDKLQSYANTLLWNETLRADAYKSKLDFKAYIKTHALPFRAMSSFGPKELEERQKLLFELCKLIWPAPTAVAT
jgi:hypothetical protein